MQACMTVNTCMSSVLACIDDESESAANIVLSERNSVNSRIVETVDVSITSHAWHMLADYLMSFYKFT